MLNQLSKKYGVNVAFLQFLMTLIVFLSTFFYMRKRLYSIIFEAETREGKIFDVVLIIAILISLLVTIIESVAAIRNKMPELFFYLELFFTLIFTVEYVLRLYVSSNKLNYAKSFFGLVDLLAILPFYISLIIPGAQSLMVIRGLRVIRVFRVLKLGSHSSAGRFLFNSIKQSGPKISVFLTAVLTLVCVMGALMYLIEGKQAGFTSIPKSMYWAVVTMTTVGYGDLVPTTALGQFLSVILMICGYAIIAVPTGIISAEMTRMSNSEFVFTKTCANCFAENHRREASHCYNCGEKLK